MDTVMIFDTTLRDGEQAAGCRIGAGEKLRIAHQLAGLGVNIIEAGFPCSSPEDFEAVRLIAREVRTPVICALSRAVATDIEACGKALTQAARPRIHTGIGVSDIHIMGKFKPEKYGHTLAEKRETTITMAVTAVQKARQYVDEVEFYAEDAGRADPAFLFLMLEAVIAAGAGVVNIPDTTGYAVPPRYGQLIRSIGEHVPNINQALISVHCHDDLGLAVANSLAGIENGARQIECTINGIGERAGNAALEEVVMALNTRRDHYGVSTEINTREFYRTSRMVAEAMGMTIPANKAVIGDNAFSHSSGIHVDGFLKERQTYEIMHPEDVGFPKSRVVLTARTGRHGVFHRFAELGMQLSDDEKEQVYARFLQVADQKQEVSDDDLIALINDEISLQPREYHLAAFKVACETGRQPSAQVQVSHGDAFLTAEALGDGPVDAAYKAIAQAVEIHPAILRYEIQAVTEGTDALGRVMVQMDHNGRRVLGRGASTDIIEASIKAYLDGLNRLENN
ncbi:MAG: 2-isopropylmalate synthase [Proteobacteria bacterium]|nr:2-isopropylmalate synthase [Pseudomonadota bacterium]MBU1687295.1 2-isopropylmalate synthase [Pseudomonadota bacterium]